MALIVKCSNAACGVMFPRPDADAGRTVTCPSCGKAVSARAPEPDPAKGRIVGGYQLVRPLAKGGMGEVYEAWHVRLNRRAALKLLSRDLARDEMFLRRFEREARTAAAINHPNIIQVFDFGTADGEAFLAMEFIDGEDLSQRVTQRGALPLEDGLRIAEDVAGALKAAHSRGVIHRDIKPANILLTKDGVAKLSDLGLARRVVDDVTLTATGVGIGTPHFMSPEQARDAHRVDHRADIYSLGITLLYLLTGRRPFEGDTSLAVLMAHAEKPLPTGADLGTPLPARVEKLIRHLAAKQPQQRYPHYDALLEDLRRVRAGGEPLCPVAAAPAANSDSETVLMEAAQARSAPTKTRKITIAGSQAAYRPRRRFRRAVVAGLAALALALLGVAVALTRKGRERVETAANAAPPDPSTPQAPIIPPARRTAQESISAFWEMTGGMPPPLPVIPPARNPLPEGTVEELWQQAGQLANHYPTSYRTVVAAFEQVLSKAAGTTLESKVKAAVREWSDRRDRAGMAAFERFKADCETCLQQGNHPQAMFVWSRFPTEVRSDALDACIWDYLLPISMPGHRARGGGPERSFEGEPPERKK